MTFIEPMLAETHPKGASLDKYGDDWYAEQKLDGERRIIRVTPDSVSTWSRIGTLHKFAPLLRRNGSMQPNPLEEELKRLPECVVDAEIQVPGGKSWDVKASKNADKLVLVLFDIIEVLGQSICGLPQSTRNEYLDTVSQRLTEGGRVTVAARYSRDDAPFQTFYDTVVDNGGEGLMLKRRSGLYRPGMRSDAWLKVKQVIEVELPCVDFSAGTTPNLLSIAHLELPNGTRTTVKARTMQDAEQWTRGPSAFIGRTMEIAAQCWTPDGSLRHPRMVRWAGPHE